MNMRCNKCQQQKTLQSTCDTEILQNFCPTFPLTYPLSVWPIEPYLPPLPPGGLAMNPQWRDFHPHFPCHHLQSATGEN